MEILAHDDPVVKTITLVCGHVVLVDAADYAVVSQYRWRMTSHGYVEKQPHDRLHRMIMGYPQGQDVDHINGDKLDNRRCNLRVCSHKDNSRNRRAESTSTSRYVGVSWNKQVKKWGVYICPNNKSIFLGLFADEKDAARAFNAAAREYYGEFAYINEVD